MGRYGEAAEQWEGEEGEEEAGHDAKSSPWSAFTAGSIWLSSILPQKPKRNVSKRVLNL